MDSIDINFALLRKIDEQLCSTPPRLRDKELLERCEFILHRMSYEKRNACQARIDHILALSSRVSRMYMDYTAAKQLLPIEYFRLSIEMGHLISDLCWFIENPNLDTKKPIIVCLCGSTRFLLAWEMAQLEETLAGRIVLTIGSYTRDDEKLRHDGFEIDTEMHAQLHLRRIDFADEILVLNVGGYVGEATRREIAYAKAQGKHIRWLEKPESEEK